jgi:hypothetical protein
MMEAVIYMKDGKRKYGMLVDSSSDENLHFVSNNCNQVEIVPVVTVDAIDTCLK